jgi:linoleoyl-CoA desaturase
MTGKISFRVKNEPFATSVRDRVDAYLARSSVQRHARLALWAKGTLFAASTGFFYSVLLTSGGSAASAVMSAMGFGISALLFALNIGHDASHTAVTGKRGIDYALQTLSYTLLGVDAYLWRLRHTASHHVFPNVNGCDIDIDHNPFFRLSPNQPNHWRFRYQHLYAPVAYCLVALHTVWWQDYRYLGKKNLANLRGIRHAYRRYLVFFLCKAAYLTLTILIPLMVLPFAWWQIALGYVAVTGVVSLCFVFLLIGTHFSTEAEFPIVGTDGRLSHGFALHVLKTSVDWNPNSRWAAFLVGGTNAHVAHHLFPRLPHVLYRPIARIIADTAKEFGLRYNSTTLRGMIAAHFRFLHAVGRSADATEKSGAISHAAVE